MERVVKRLQIRLFAEADEIPDNQALAETQLVRHLNRLEDLSRDCMKTWVLSALRNQLIAERGALFAPTEKTASNESTINIDAESNDTPKGEDKWSVDDSASGSMSIM